MARDPGQKRANTLYHLKEVRDYRLAGLMSKTAHDHITRLPDFLRTQCPIGDTQKGGDDMSTPIERMFCRNLPPAAKPWTGFPTYNFVGGHNNRDATPVEALASAMAQVDGAVLPDVTRDRCVLPGRTMVEG